MPPALQFRLQEGKIRVLREAIESWKRDHEPGVLTYDMEELIAESLACWEDLRRAWVRTQKLATSNRLGNLQDAGTNVLENLRRCLAVLADVTGLIGTVARETGQSLERPVELSEAIREASELREHVLATWPWDDRPILPLNRNMVEESRAARARGESQEVADLLAGLGASAPFHQEW